MCILLTQAGVNGKLSVINKQVISITCFLFYSFCYDRLWDHPYSLNFMLFTFMEPIKIV